MILYVGASLYHILCFSIHKIRNHPTEDALLVIGDNIFSKSGMKELKKDLEQTQIFKRVEILKFIEGAYSNPYKITRNSDEERIDQYIRYNEEWIEDWLSKKDIRLSDYTEFNSAIDHRHLGLYLLSKRISYQYFEDGNGLLSRRWVQLEFHKKAQYASYAVCKRLHALGENDIVTKKYANQSAQEEGFYDDKMEDFEVTKLFKILDEKDQKKILQMFHAKKLELPKGKDPVLYLTRYVRYLQKPTIENHEFISSMIVDLFANDHPLIVKPHPRDFTGRYQHMFQDAIVLPKQFPSELLPFLYDGKYEKIITTGSTAIDALKNYGKEVIKLDIEFENKVYAIYQYTASVLFARKMFPNLTKDEIAIAGCSMELMNPLCREFLGFEASAQIDKNKKYKVILCDEVGEEVSSKDLKADCICYLNTDHDYRFADDIKQGFENIHYLNVLVRQTKENAIGKDQEHAIFVNTKDQKIVDKLERFFIRHEFFYTGVEMFVGNASMAQKQYIQIVSEILWTKSMQERNTNQTIFLNLPKMKKHISPNDIKMMKQLLKKVKEERNFNESNSLCTNEVK